jgi:hypothetical protein
MVSERDFQTAVVDLARLKGWRVAHFRPAQTSKGWRTPVEADGKGFPDLVLARAGRVILLELKSARGRVSPEQGEWLKALGGSAYVIRPADWNELQVILR